MPHGRDQQRQTPRVESPWPQSAESLADGDLNIQILAAVTLDKGCQVQDSLARLSAALAGRYCIERELGAVTSLRRPPKSAVRPAFGRSVAILNLPWLIKVKRGAGRLKDLEVIAELEVIEEELRRLE